MNASLNIKNSEILFKFRTNAYALYQQLDFSKYHIDQSQEQSINLLEYIFRKINQKFKENKTIQKSQRHQIQKLQSEAINLKDNSQFLKQNTQLLKSNQLKLKEKISLLNQECTRTTERLIWREKQNQQKQIIIFELESIIKQKDQKISLCKKYCNSQKSQNSEQEFNFQSKLNFQKQQQLEKQKIEFSDIAVMTVQQKYISGNQNHQANVPSQINSSKNKQDRCNCDNKYSNFIKDLQKKNHFLQKQYDRVQNSYAQLKDQYQNLIKKSYEFILQNTELRNKNVALCLENQKIKQQIALLKDNNNNLLELLNPPQKILQKKIIGQNLQNIIIPKYNHILVYKSKRLKEIISQNQLLFKHQQSQFYQSKANNQPTQMILQSLDLSKTNSIFNSSVNKGYYQNIRHQIKQIISQDGSIANIKLDNQTKDNSIMTNSTFLQTVPRIKNSLQKSQREYLNKSRRIFPERTPSFQIIK